MHDALTSFKAEIDKLSRFLDTSDAEIELVKAILHLPRGVRANLDGMLDIMQNNRLINKRQRFVSSIIVMYGALERFVEEARSRVLRGPSGVYIGSFQSLPEKLRERHTQLTIDYLALLKDGKVRKTEEITTVVETLHDCFSGKVPYRLNARAFSLRSSNMNIARIREITGNLEVDFSVRRVVSSPAYAAFLSETEGLSVTDMKDSEIQHALDHIDELVGLRNDIAHGVVNLESIDDIDVVRGRVDVLHAFANAFNEILVCEVLTSRIALEQLVPVHGIVQVFGDHVACFSWPTGRLVLGDYLVMQPGDQSAELRHGPISSIQINRVDQTEVEGRAGLMIGVCVPFRVRENGTFYVWHTMGA